MAEVLLKLAINDNAGQQHAQEVACAQCVDSPSRSLHRMQTRTRLCWQVEAEHKLAEAAKEGLHKKLAEAEARVASMSDTVEDLRMGLAQQREHAGAR